MGGSGSGSAGEVTSVRADGHAHARSARPLLRLNVCGVDEVAQLVQRLRVNLVELLFGHEVEKNGHGHVAGQQYANVGAHVVAGAEQDAAEQLHAVGHGQRAAELEEIGEAGPGGVELGGGDAERVVDADGGGGERAWGAGERGEGAGAGRGWGEG